ncbi:MAG TPA: hypothetical protein VFM58_24955 [Solirubrobacteraceae bacterium]|nr:hypothetical protein [Solirubrobacteraceae bacterium]
MGRLYAMLARAVFAVFEPDPLPFVILMGVGFVIGIGGHVYKSRTAIATGIGMIFVATILLPLGLYLHDN